MDGDTVSRQHCRLRVDGSAVRLEDLRSGNGTFVNDQRLSGSRTLVFSDTIRVGIYSLKIRPIHAAGPIPFDPIACAATTRLEPGAGADRDPALATISISDEETETELDGRWRSPTPRPDELAARQCELSALFVDLGTDEPSAATDTAPDGPTRDAAGDVHRPSATAAPGALATSTGVWPPFESDTVRAFADIVAAQLERESGWGGLGPKAEGVPGPDRRLPDIVHPSRLMTPTDQKIDVRPTASRSAHEPHPPRGKPRRSTTVTSARPDFLGIEVAARTRGRLTHIAVLRGSDDEYVLGYPSPQGPRTPARRHVGLRLLKINEDRTVDLVFPDDVAGYLVRGGHTVLLPALTQGRKYSCLRLEPDDVAAVHIGCGNDRVSYHLRFLKRPASVLRDLMRARRP